MVCVDTEGYLDGEDDGPETGEMAKLFKEVPNCTASLSDGKMSDALRAAINGMGISIDGRLRVKADGENAYKVTVKGEETSWLRLVSQGNRLEVQQLTSEEAADGKVVGTIETNLTSGLDEGKASDVLSSLLAANGFDGKITSVETATSGKIWNLKAEWNGEPRQLQIRREGPNLAAYKLITIADKEEADTVWRYDMMGELGVSQHNMCSCSVTALGDILFVNTSNGVDESHVNIPSIECTQLHRHGQEHGRSPIGRTIRRRRTSCMGNGLRQRLACSAASPRLFSRAAMAGSTASGRMRARTAHPNCSGSSTPIPKTPSGFSGDVERATISSPRRCSTMTESTSRLARTPNTAKGLGICGASIPPNEVT